MHISFMHSLRKFLLLLLKLESCMLSILFNSICFRKLFFYHKFPSLSLFLSLSLSHPQFVQCLFPKKKREFTLQWHSLFLHLYFCILADGRIIIVKKSHIHGYFRKLFSHFLFAIPWICSFYLEEKMKVKSASIVE